MGGIAAGSGKQARSLFDERRRVSPVPRRRVDHSLADHLDADLTDASDGKVIQFVGTSRLWVPGVGGVSLSPATVIVTETVFGQSAAVGTATGSYARPDHTHGTPQLAGTTQGPIVVATAGPIRTSTAHPRLEVNAAGAGLTGGMLQLTNSAGTSMLRLYNGASGVAQVVVGVAGGEEMGFASSGSPPHLFLQSGDAAVYDVGHIGLQKVGAGGSRQEQIYLTPSGLTDGTTRRRPLVELRNQSYDGTLDCQVRITSSDLVIPNDNIQMGAATRQMLNLYNADWGIGVQSGTLYHRSATNFAWHRGGVHSNTALDPGTGGTLDMALIGGLLRVYSDYAEVGYTNYRIRLGEVYGDRGISAYSSHLRLNVDSTSTPAAGQIRLSINNLNHLVVRATATSGAGYETIFTNPNESIGSSFVRICHTGSAGNGFIDTVNGGLYLNWYAGAVGGYNVIIGNGGQAYGALLCDTIYRNTEATPSDASIKTGIRALPYGLDEVKAMRPVAFRYTASPDVARIGFTWSEMAALIPEACVDRSPPIPPGSGAADMHFARGIDLSKLIPVLVSAVQELADRVAALEA